MSLENYKTEYERWLAQARADLKAAAGSLKNESFDWAAFQCQQAGEKALKALWYCCASDPWGHSLVKLIQDFPVENVRARLQAVMPHAKKLDKLYIPTRYPIGLPALIPAEVFTQEEAQDAIKTAETILDCVRSIAAAMS